MKQNEEREREYLKKALEVAHTVEVNLVEKDDIMARANLGYLIGYLEGGLKHYEK